MTRSVEHIEVPVGQVYDALVDAPQYPTWLLGAREIRRPERAWPRAGSSFDHHVGAGPVEVADRTTVVRNEPGRVLELLVRARPFLEANVTFRVAGEGTGTRIEMTERPVGPFRLIAPLIAPLVVHAVKFGGSYRAAAEAAIDTYR